MSSALFVQWHLIFCSECLVAEHLWVVRELNASAAALNLTALFFTR
jgi:hypothetical protein